MYKPEISDFFNAESCDFCGKCLEECPVFGESVVAGRDIIKRLVQVNYDVGMLRHCSSCMSCNTLCPHDCNPYGLIMFNWFCRYLDKGVPVRTSLILPLDDANAWFGAREYFPPDEKSLLLKWSNLERPELRNSDKVMYAGCNLQAMPYLTFSSLFEEYDIFGAQELCCGELYYRAGLLDTAVNQADILRERLDELGIKEFTAYCQACYNNMKNIYINNFGVNLGSKISYFGDLLAERVLSGELPVKDKLKGMKVTVHEPCHAKILGRDFMEKPRAILEHMGAEVIEMRHNHEMGLCCGAGHFVSTYNPFFMVSGIIKRLMEARATGADYLVVYCNTCYMILTGGILLTPVRIPIIHLNELVSLALDEELPQRNRGRVARIMQGIFLKGAGKAVSPQRIWV